MDILRPTIIIYHIISGDTSVITASLAHTGGVDLISVFNMDSSMIVGSELTSTGVSATEETFTIVANLKYIAAF